MLKFMSIRDYFCLGKKFLVYNIVSRNLKVKYRRSFLGVFWTILAPLSTALMYFLVFKVVLKVQKSDYLILVISGVMAWTYFAQTLNECVAHYVEQQNLITKIAFPFHVFTLSTSLTNLVTLLFAMPIAMAVALIQGKGISWSILFLPYFLGCLFFSTYALSAIAAVSYVFFRDLRQLIVVILQMMFYGTPILYTVDMVPSEYRWVLKFNPVGDLIPAIQNCITGNGPWTYQMFALPLLWTIGFSILSSLLLRKFRYAVVENL